MAASRTAVVVQARVGSSRLPGKVLRELAGRSVLDHVLTRCKSISQADVVVCATTTGKGDDPVAEAASKLGALVFRGSENDVLARYMGAAEVAAADVVLRVTSDCPLIDPPVCDAVISLRARQAVDYACNNMPPTWPHGLDCECFTVDALKDAFENAALPAEREHVTPYIRNNSRFTKANYAKSGEGASEFRWTLDYPEDLDFLAAIHDRFGRNGDLPEANALIQLVRNAPDLDAINAMRKAPSHAAAGHHS